MVSRMVSAQSFIMFSGGWIMVLILDGNSEIGEYQKSLAFDLFEAFD